MREFIAPLSSALKNCLVSFETTSPDAVVRVKASLLRTGFVANYEFVSDGLPTFEMHNPVADLVVTSLFAEKRDKNLVGPILIIVGIVLGAFGLVSGILTAVLVHVDETTFTWMRDWFCVIFVCLPGGAACVGAGVSASLDERDSRGKPCASAGSAMLSMTNRSTT
ncbi:hypothetical protein [Microbacterium sp. CGR1]|uniref:hypothetical protein n=1 Tax=Microbacterium sp. CGR1 TaxID=1696072 RepID=UPI003DA2B735